MSDIYFEIPLRLPNTEYKYGDLVAANEVYATPLEVALADIRLSLAANCAFVDLGAGGTLTPFLGSKIEVSDSAGKKVVGYIGAAGRDYAPQAVSLTASATGGGITVANNANINNGTNNFAFIWKGSLPDWTPPASRDLLSKQEDNGNYIRFRVVDTTGVFNLTARTTAGWVIIADSTIGNTIADNNVAEIIVVVTREKLGVAGSVAIYINRVLLETISIPAAATVDISNTGVFNVNSFNDVCYEGEIHYAYMLNFAPTAAEITAMSAGGIPESWKWGSQTPVTDSFTLANTRLSLVDGAAFVDFSEADVLTNYIDAEITIADSAGKKAVGYIKAAGTGGIFQTRTGSGIWHTFDGITWDLINGQDPPVFVSSNTDAYAYFSGAGIYQWTNPGWVQLNAGTPTVMVISAGLLYCNFSGEIYQWDGITWNPIYTGMPTPDPALPSVVGVTIVSTIGGSTYNWESIETGFNAADPAGYTTSIRVCGATLALEPAGINTTNWTDSSTNDLDAAFPASGVEILYAEKTPPVSTTGVTIVSTSGGTVQDWESIEAGFNANDPAGYTVQIYRSGYIYRCSDPGISAATPPEFDRSPGALTIDGGVIWTQATPSGMRYRTACTFDANPRYGDYRRGKKYFQPMDRADGGDLYVYDKGLAAENARSIGWEKILPADLTRLLEFIEMVRGAAYPFNFYDENGMVHQVRITNPGEIKSAPESHNFEGGITIELLFINEPEATETEEAYYADGTCFADGTIYAG